jgi:hypothetical protein
MAPASPAAHHHNHSRSHRLTDGSRPTVFDLSGGSIDKTKVRVVSCCAVLVC